MARIIGRLKAKLYISLPSVEETKFIEIAVPPLYVYATDCLAKELVIPWTYNHQPYLNLAETDPGFRETLGQCVQKILFAQIKVGEEYYKRTTNRQV